MVFMLRRQLSLVQWFALFLLFIGISLVQVENMTSTTPKQDVNAVYGFLAVIIACKFQINNQIISSYFYFLGTFSGLAGVYFEKILKGSDVSVWIRNIQLGVFGIFFGIITMILSDGTEVKAKGFLFGYTKMVWIATIVHSVGGLIVALVVKHADNILKGFATSSAIVLSCIVSMLLFDFQLTLLFTVGAGLVIFSIFLYSKPDLILSVPIINIFFKDRSVLF
jgi:UDP-galactose transporter